MFQIEIRELKTVISQLALIVPNRRTATVLECVLFKDGRVIANNLSESVSIPLYTPTDNLLANFKQLTEFAKGCKVPKKKTEKAFVTFNGSTVSYNNISVTLDTEPENDYPDTLDNLTSFTADKIIAFADDELKSLANVAYAASKDESKHALQSLNFNCRPLTIEVSATDGHRIAHKTLHVETEIEGSINLPAETFQKALKIFKDCTYTTMTLSEDRETILIQSEGLTLAARVNADIFPDVVSFIPPDFDVALSFNRKQVLEVLEAGKKLAGRKVIPSVTITDAGDDLKLVIRECLAAKDSLLTARVAGKITSELDVDKEVSYTLNYLLDIIKCSKSEEINLQLVSDLENNGTRRLDFRPAVISDDGVTHLIMPLRKSR